MRVAVEAAHSVIRCDEGIRKQYLHRCHKMPKGVAASNLIRCSGPDTFDIAGGQLRRSKALSN